MNYAMEPPEIISAKIYSGPGSSPLLAAASAWGAVSAELHSTAVTYQAMISRLIGEEWLGPASTAMAANANTYAVWLETTAAHAERVATQARAAAAAYEQTRAIAVPPTAITANRALRQQLVQTNFFGMNAPAIASTEAQYGEMWAQDSLAMAAYDADSTAATALDPLAEPPGGGSDAGAAQSGALARAAESTASNVSGVPGAPDPSVPAPPSATPGPTDVLTHPAVGFTQQSLANGLQAGRVGGEAINGVWRGFSGVLGAAKMMGDAAKAASGAGAAAGIASAAEGLAGGGLSGVGSLAGATGSLGGAGAVGGLSVPASWASAPVGSSFGPVSGGTWQPIGGATLAGATGTAPHGMPGVPGAPLAGVGAGRGGGPTGPPRYGSKITVMPRFG